MKIKNITKHIQCPSCHERIILEDIGDLEWGYNLIRCNRLSCGKQVLVRPYVDLKFRVEELDE
jgi:DNA-directed RNA polymerase subunit RPC12/RpoP